MNNEPIEIQLARENDAKQSLNENAQIDKLMDKLKTMKGKPLAQIRDEAHQVIAEKSVFSYAQRSAKQLFSLMGKISNLKRNATDSSKLDAVLENQKILASLIIQLKLNNRQLYEFKSNVK